jgi:hypothetical protein
MISCMQTLSKWLSSLAITVVGLVVVAFVLDATVLSAQHWKQSAKTADFYTGMAKALPAIIIPMDGELPGADVVRASLSAKITPDYTEAKFNDLFDGVEANLRQNAPVPKFDLTDLAGEAQRAKLAGGFGTAFAKPVEINLPAGPRLLFQAVQWLKGWGLGAAILAALLVALAAGRKWLKRLGQTLLLSALLPLICFGLSGLLPPVITGRLDSKGDAGVMAQPLTRLVEQVLTGTGQMALYAGAALAVAGIGLIIGQRAWLKRHSNELKPMKSPSRPSL